MTAGVPHIVTGKVTWWKDDEGYGEVTTELGPIEVAFAVIERMPGFRRLLPGEVVTLEVMLFDEGPDNPAAPGFVGWANRAVRGETLDGPPTEQTAG